MQFLNGHFYSVNQYYKELFGFKVYKISLDASCTCPNRDGTKAYGGCIFCSARGSGDFAANRNSSIQEQVEEGKKIVSGKIKNCQKIAYIAYFQNFTSTYGETSSLLEKYKAALSCKDVIGLTVATRPDCLVDDMLEALAELSKKFYVSIELGFQTSKEASVKYIRRFYDNYVFDDCVQRIKQKASLIHVVSHLIFGLPFESKRDMLNSVRYVIKNRVDGIKISLLHVLEGTDLAEDYFEGKFKILKKNEYFDIVAQAIEIIPENIVLHRITGDGAKKSLIAPLWSANKKDVLNSFNKFLDERNVIQGSKAF